MCARHVGPVFDAERQAGNLFSYRSTTVNNQSDHSEVVSSCTLLYLVAPSLGRNLGHGEAAGWG